MRCTLSASPARCLPDGSHYRSRRAGPQPEKYRLRNSARPVDGRHRACPGRGISLAFDTIYAEGQRRYVESLSAYARQFLERMEKPDVDHIDGLAPAIAIKQKNTTRNPRSTVAHGDRDLRLSAAAVCALRDDVLPDLRRRCEARQCGRNCGRGAAHWRSKHDCCALFPVVLPEIAEANNKGANRKKIAKSTRRARQSRPKKMADPLQKHPLLGCVPGRQPKQIAMPATTFRTYSSLRSAPADPREQRLGELRQRGFNRLYQIGTHRGIFYAGIAAGAGFSQPLFVLHRSNRGLPERAGAHRGRSGNRLSRKLAKSFFEIVPASARKALDAKDRMRYSGGETPARPAIACIANRNRRCSPSTIPTARARVARVSATPSISISTGSSRTKHAR